MAKDRPVVVEVPGQCGEAWHIIWFLADEGDYGATIGEYTTVKEYRDMLRGGPPADPDEHDFYYVTVAADRVLGQEALAGRVEHTRDGYVFSSKSAAVRALREINAVVKALRSERPWPKWAITAVENGWTAPKNWRP